MRIRLTSSLCLLMLLLRGITASSGARAQVYTVVPLEGSGSSHVPYAINNAGIIVGSTDNNPDGLPCLWDKNGFHLITDLIGATNAGNYNTDIDNTLDHYTAIIDQQYGYAINNNGQVLMGYQFIDPYDSYWQHTFTFNYAHPTTTFNSLIFGASIAYQPYGPSQTANAINDLGDVVGAKSVQLVGGGEVYPDAVFWNGKVDDMGRFGDGTQVTVVNNSLQMAGTGFYHTGTGPLTNADLVPALANANVFVMNNLGVIGGSLVDPVTSALQAFVYKPGALAKIPNAATVFGINDGGVVVGQTISGDPYVYDSTNGSRNPNTLLGKDSPWTINEVTAINNKGQITGIGVSSGYTGPLVLNPPAVVLLVHGVWSDHVTPWTNVQNPANSMITQLSRAGYITETIDFNSALNTRSNEAHIADQALALSLMIPTLLKTDNVTTLDLVCHSMGGLAARWYLNHPPLWRCVNSSGKKYSGVQKLIMIGTPNWGSDSWVLNPLIALVTAYHDGAIAAATYLGRQPVDQVGNWSPALHDMYAEWMPPPTKPITIPPSPYSYPAGYKTDMDEWPSPLGSEEYGPITNASQAATLGAIIKKGYFLTPGETQVVKQAYDLFPYDDVARFIVHDNYYGQQESLLAGSNLYPNPNPAQPIEGVNTRRISDAMWELNVNSTDDSGAQIYLVAGYYDTFSVLGLPLLQGPYHLIQSDGIVPRYSVLGIDPITNKRLFPLTNNYLDADDNHVELPHDPVVINQVIEWLGE